VRLLRPSRWRGGWPRFAGFAAVYALVLQTFLVGIAGAASVGVGDPAAPHGIICLSSAGGGTPASPARHDPSVCQSCCVCAPNSAAAAPPSHCVTMREGVAAATEASPRSSAAPEHAERASHRPRGPPGIA
jgi:hypothetical protein